MLLLLESSTSHEMPLPELSVDYVRPRGLVVFGGPPLSGRIPRLTVTARDGYGSAAGIPDFMRSVGFCFVSARLRCVFESSAAEIEYLPINLVYGSSCNANDYFLANPLRNVRGVDLTRSDIELDEAGIALSCRSLAINESLFDHLPVSVLHETLHLVVQSHVEAAIRQAGLTGCSFKGPREVRF